MKHALGWFVLIYALLFAALPVVAKGFPANEQPSRADLAGTNSRAFMETSMPSYIGDEIGADDVNAMMRDLGIRGDDDGVGDDGEISGKHRLKRRQVVPNPNVGRPRYFPMLLALPATTATTANASLTGTADRDAVLRKVHLFCSLETTYANAAAGTASSYTDNKALCFLTAVSVGGRNAVIGSGNAAIRGFDRDAVWVPNFGVLAAGNPVTLTINNGSAVTQQFSGFFAAQCVD